MSPRFVPEVFCLDCCEPIVLHIPTLAPIHDRPMGQATRFVPVAVSCPRCKRVAIYDHRDQLRQMNTTQSFHEAERIVLRCAEEGCEGSLAVFSFAEPVDWQAEIDTWTFGAKVRCSNGHRFRR
jgi:hypothetical protein